MDNPNCNVCGALHGDALYRSAAGRSLTSLCQIHPTATVVYACSKCGHVQSETLAGVESYYDDDYDILVHSEEEDQVYEVRNGKPVYRTEHQVRTLLAKVSLPEHTNLLDYGCAKSSTIRALTQLNPGIAAHLFDVSERFIPFWRKFVLPDQWSVHTTKPEWVSKFDVVTSFFSLEHIPKPAETMRHIADLLKPGGTFYCIVPNVSSNIADFIVVDHCNHFTRPSLTRVLSGAGMELREIDDLAHRGAFVVVATKSGQGPIALGSTDPVCVDETRREMIHIARFWREAGERIRTYESGLADNERVAIYGAGFYGAFVASSLARPDRIACHLDQNPFLQGTAFNALPVWAPADLPL
ncbi:MAG: class I SAM-dependent methyltransferase, partial [Lysobacter sp.]